MAWTSPRTWSSEVLASTTLNTHLRDNLLHICSTTGNLTITPTGPHALGTSPLGNAAVLIGGSYDATGTANSSVGLWLNPTISVAANQVGALEVISGTLVEASSGTHAIMAGLYVNPPTITGAGATTTSAITAYIAGAPSGGSANYALYVASGTTVLAGNTLIGGSVSATSTGPHSFGALAADTNTQFTIQGTWSPVSTGISFRVIPTINAVANNDVSAVSFAPTIVEAGSGTHNIFASAQISAPTITGGAAALTNCFSLYVSVPTSGTFTSGLHIEGAGNDGVYVSLSDATDVAHGVTDLAPTSVFFVVRKASATAGGVSLQGATEDTGAFSLVGTATNVITTETGGSRGNISLVAQVKSGTGVTTHAADDNIVVFLNGPNATHIFKGNGDSYEDGTGWTAYDEHDDVALIEALEYEITSASGNPIKQVFSQWMTERRPMLERLRLASFGEDGRVFVNRSGMQALICGYARQMTHRVMDLEARVTALEAA